jgi:hypothetical protein
MCKLRKTQAQESRSLSLLPNATTLTEHGRLMIRPQRAEAISQFFSSTNPSARVAAFQEIERLGREALPRCELPCEDLAYYQ